MRRLKVGLNGFGRIGRSFTRIAFERDTFDIVAVNTRKTPTDMMAYLLKYDSVYRRFGKNVELDGDIILIDGKKVPTTRCPEAADIHWEQYGADVVIDSTGAFMTLEALRQHKQPGVKHVILTAMSKDKETPTIVLGANDENLKKDLDVFANASCTTNCTAPMFKVMHDAFGIISGFVTTAHSYTVSQSLVDESNKDKDMSRAAALNMIPSSTGAAKAVARVLPHLQGKLDGMALRVPTPTVSFADLSIVTEKTTTIEEINQAFREAAEKSHRGIIQYETEPLVQSDYIGSPYSCIFAAQHTKVMAGNLVKVFGWYDNEWGYSCRLADLVEKLGAMY